MNILNFLLKTKYNFCVYIKFKKNFYINKNIKSVYHLIILNTRLYLVMGELKNYRLKYNDI